MIEFPGLDIPTPTTLSPVPTRNFRLTFESMGRVLRRLTVPEALAHYEIDPIISSRLWGLVASGRIGEISRCFDEHFNERSDAGAPCGARPTRRCRLFLCYSWRRNVGQQGPGFPHTGMHGSSWLVVLLVP